jgi:hypothetical protein
MPIDLTPNQIAVLDALGRHAMDPAVGDTCRTSAGDCDGTCTILPPSEDLDEVYGDRPRTNESDGDILVEPRHEHSWVTDRIAVGSGIYTATDVAVVRDAGITHVIDCRTTEEPHVRQRYRDAGIDVLNNPTPDDGARKPPEWFARGIRYALQALRDPAAKLLVHCAAGVSRSPSLTYAILRALGRDPVAAEAEIRMARSFVCLTYRLDAERVPWVAR